MVSIVRFVATHLTGRPQCREGLRSFEAVGGAMLEAAAPSASARTPLRGRSLDSMGPIRLRKPAPRVLHSELPPPLNAYEFCPWRFVHPGFQWRRLTLPESPDANVIMLKVAAGWRVPHHGHSGTEYTQVLKGSFADALGQYRAGDCVEADEG